MIPFSSSTPPKHTHFCCREYFNVQIKFQFPCLLAPKYFLFFFFCRSTTTITTASWKREIRSCVYESRDIIKKKIKRLRSYNFSIYSILKISVIEWANKKEDTFWNLKHLQKMWWFNLRVLTMYIDLCMYM